MKRLIVVLLAVLSLAVSACGGASTPGTAPIPTVTQVMTSHYIASLSALNRSGVSGTVDFQVTGNVLVVKMQVIELVPNQKHFQHIHGNGTATCPTATDVNGGVTLSEALTNIGPLAFDLQPYPLTDAQGRLNLTQTFTLDPDELANITPLTGHVMVLHGTFNQGHYDRFLPAACGLIRRSHMAQEVGGTRLRIYSLQWASDRVISCCPSKAGWGALEAICASLGVNAP